MQSAKQHIINAQNDIIYNKFLELISYFQN